MKNQAIMFDRLGGPEVLHVAEFDEPEPGPGEVCIRCTSAGLNRAELPFREGQSAGTARVTKHAARA